MKNRKLSDIPLEERREILIKLETRKMREVADEHGVTKNTIGHIRYYHHPKSSAQKRGDYFKDLLGDYVPPVLARIKQLKAEGELSSAQVAKIVGMPLAQVNRLWIS